MPRYLLIPLFLACATLVCACEQPDTEPGRADVAQQLSTFDECPSNYTCQHIPSCGADVFVGEHNDMILTTPDGGVIVLAHGVLVQQPEDDNLLITCDKKKLMVPYPPIDPPEKEFRLDPEYVFVYTPKSYGQPVALSSGLVQITGDVIVGSDANALTVTQL